MGGRASLLWYATRRREHGPGAAIRMRGMRGRRNQLRSATKHTQHNVRQRVLSGAAQQAGGAALARELHAGLAAMQGG